MSPRSGILVALLVAGIAAVVLLAAGDGNSNGAIDPTDGPIATCAEVLREGQGRPTGTCRTDSAILTIAPEGQPLVLLGLRVRLIDVLLKDAETPSGRERDRARVLVRVQVKNLSDAVIKPNRGGSQFYLSVGSSRVHADPRAMILPSALPSEPLSPGESVAGNLRFEVGGATSRRFLRTGGDLGVVAPATDGEERRIGVIPIAPEMIAPATDAADVRAFALP